MNLKDNLVKILKQQNHTYEELAKYLGTSIEELDESIINHSMDVRTLEMIAKELKLPLYRLFRDPLGDLTQATEYYKELGFTLEDVIRLKTQLDIALQEIESLKKELELVKAKA
jgi:transcriptional regulator with XRE-family HTH domain